MASQPHRTTSAKLSEISRDHAERIDDIIGGSRCFMAHWPVLNQLATLTDGTSAEAMSDRTRTLRPRTEGADVTRSICPYCAVGCGQLIFHQHGRIVSVEGDPASTFAFAFSSSERRDGPTRRTTRT